MVPLGEVARFIRGITFKPTDLEPPSEGNIDCFRTRNVQLRLDESDVWSIPSSFLKRQEQLLREADILISSANSWNLVGRCCWIPALSRPTTFGGFVTALRGDPKVVEARYLFHWFSSVPIQEKLRSFGNQTTNISNLDLKRAGNLPTPLPPLDEQRRIAAILDKADELRSKRREALDHLDALTQSIFNEMFGDPTQNSRFPQIRLENLLEGVDSGQSPVCEDRPAADEEWSVLKLGAVTKMIYDPAQNKALLSTPDPRHEVRAGDVLFSRKNTREHVAAVAFVRKTPPRRLLPDLIFRLKIRTPAQITPEYLQAVLAHPRKRKQVQGLAGGSAGSMPNISKSKLLTVSIPVPLRQSQMEFTNRVAAVERLKDHHRTQLAHLDTLFASLQHRAFKGEL
ncbi:restriction endonuclease subunit S [Arthrobacter pigmenti]|nr:restriction endonuclease subunit S [Arthrobacter pigmenti]